ncbi:MAG: preprotein translocase subunit SecG [Acidimicrobiia bacterium]
MLDTIYTIFAIVTGLMLVVLVLLHAGRGGGLSDMFGGGMGGSMAGATVVERNLDRMTVVASLLFVFSIILIGLRA